MHKRKIKSTHAVFEYFEREDFKQAFDVAKLTNPFSFVPSMVIYVRDKNKQVKVLWCSAYITSGFTSEMPHDKLVTMYNSTCHYLTNAIKRTFEEKEKYTILRIVHFTKGQNEFKYSNLYDGINATLIPNLSKYTSSKTHFTIQDNVVRMRIQLAPGLYFIATNQSCDNSVKRRHQVPTPSRAMYGEFMLSGWPMLFALYSTAVRLTEVMPEETIKARLIERIEDRFIFITRNSNFKESFMFYPAIKAHDGEVVEFESTLADQEN